MCAKPSQQSGDTRYEIAAEPTAAPIVLKTVDGTKKAKLQFLNKILGIIVGNTSLADISIQRSPVPSVKLLPAQSVIPITQAIKEGDPCCSDTPHGC